MTTWYVSRSGKDTDGDITSLCGESPTRFHHAKSLVIQNKTGGDKYIVWVAGHPQVEVLVRERYGKPYLTTNPDSYGPNNLDNLDNC